MTLIWTVRAMLVLDVVLLIALPFLQSYSGSDAAGNGMAQGFAAIGAVIGLILIAVLALIWWWVTVRWALMLVGGLVAAMTVFLMILTVFSFVD